MVWLYNNPEGLDYGQIDEPIRELCKEINESSWLRTEESCCGHPDPNEKMRSAWGGDDLYLRVCVIDKLKLSKLFSWFESIRDDGLQEWHSGLRYDRTDEDGIHFYIDFSYAKKLDYRKIAIDYITKKFMEENYIETIQKTKEDGGKTIK